MNEIIEYENLSKLNSPFFAEYQKVFEDVMKKGWYILGSQVANFESSFATFCEAPHCVGVANGLDGLVISLKAFDFPDDSEIIVPSNTYIATILSITQNKLKPVLVEPDINTYNIDPILIRKSITSKTKAIMVVHLYGKSCDMDPILEICKEFGLKLIEDCAQSHGARYKGKMTGTFGDAGVFSFYPTKNLGALGDAGAVITSNNALFEKIKTLRNYGSKVKYYNELPGYNSRLDELQAAFLSVKLKKINDITSHKRSLAEVYHSTIENRFIKPVIDSDYFDVYHIYNIRHPHRDQLKEYLLANGVRTEIHYPVSPNKQQAMKGILDMYQTPLSEEIHRTTLSLPISYFHTIEDVTTVSKIINSFKEF